MIIPGISPVAVQVGAVYKLYSISELMPVGRIGLSPLSLGFDDPCSSTILFKHMQTELQQQGLEPMFGFVLHEPDGGLLSFGRRATPFRDSGPFIQIDVPPQSPAQDTIGFWGIETTRIEVIESDSLVGGFLLLCTAAIADAA